MAVLGWHLTTRKPELQIVLFPLVGCMNSNLKPPVRWREARTVPSAHTPPLSWISVPCGAWMQHTARVFFKHEAR